ncbi:MAG: CBS domain-containing protein [Clostridiales bacterium]|nr:CBS domain-containing protein [Clostridiales bacterium]
MNILFLLTNKTETMYLFDDDTVASGLAIMRERRFAAIPVIKKTGEYVGTVCEGDFLWSVMDSNMESAHSDSDCKIRDIIRNWWNNPITIDESVEEVVERLMHQNFVPVVDDRNFFMGIITRSSVMSYYTKKMELLEERTVCSEDTLDSLDAQAVGIINA